MVAPGREQAHERGAEVVAQAHDADVRFEVLQRGVRTLRAGQDDQAVAAIARGERGEGGLADPAGRAQSAAGRGDAAGVDRLERSREQIDSFDEERSLLGIKQGEALVGADLSHVALDLGEVRVEGGVDGGVGKRAPLHVHPDVRIQVAAGERRSEAGLRLVDALGGGVGRHHQMRPMGQIRESGQRARVADEAAHVSRQARREELIVAVARVVAVEQDAPGGRLGARVAQ